MTSNGRKQTILVIEDAADIRRLVAIRLGHAGFETIEADSGMTGLKMLHEHHPDAIVLDIGLPDLDGWQVLQRIRDISSIPVLILTARGLEAEKVRGLQSGADDYVTKPFGHQELVARVIALLRRAGTEAPVETSYVDQHLAIDIPTRSVRVDGEEVALTPGEFRLLLALVNHAGQVLSPEQLLDLAWDDPTHTNSSRVRFTVLRLRRKLGWDDTATSPIESVRGFGYRYRLVEGLAVAGG